jgi:hypothetical protein
VGRPGKVSREPHSGRLRKEVCLKEGMNLGKGKQMSETGVPMRRSYMEGKVTFGMSVDSLLLFSPRGTGTPWESYLTIKHNKGNAAT